jgi:hypothetical protein
MDEIFRPVGPAPHRCVRSSTVRQNRDSRCAWTNEGLSQRLRLREITHTSCVFLSFRLRFDVWNSETELKSATTASSEIRDAHDDHARHWAVFRDEEMVASARMCVHNRLADTPDYGALLGIELDAPVATLNRLVVHQGARRDGLATRLDECRISAALAVGARCIVGTVPEYRIPALKKLGFRMTGQRWIPEYAQSMFCYAMVLEL